MQVRKLSVLIGAVGNLETFPIVDGSEVILKITGSGEVQTFATGFTTILGLAFDSHDKLYVLENTTDGNEFPTAGTGKTLRLHPDDASGNGASSQLAQSGHRDNIRLDTSNIGYVGLRHENIQ